MRWFSALLLGLYLLLVARLTLADPSAGQFAFSAADTWATRLSGGALDWSETEVLANVALFVPIGFLVTLVLGRPGVGVALCVIASVGIELAQQRWFPARVPSLADVRHNSLGGAFGVLMAWPVSRLQQWKQPMVA